MKRLDQGHPHPLLEHPKKNIPQPEIEPGPSASQHSSTELFEQLYAVAIRNPYSTNFFFVTMH
jgi:hypothetical protein